MNTEYIMDSYNGEFWDLLIAHGQRCNAAMRRETTPSGVIRHLDAVNCVFSYLDEFGVARHALNVMAREPVRKPSGDRE